MDLDLSDYIQRNVYIGSYEVEEVRWVKQVLGAGMTCVDVGANVGYYTLLTSRLVGPGGRVIAFEPSPYAFERLRTLIKTNGLAHAHCFHMALGSERGNLTLYIPPDSSHNHNPNLLSGDEGCTAITVPVRTLDSYVQTLGIEQIDLLKIDVEGFEPYILLGAEESIRRGKIRAILSEFHPSTLARAGSSPDAMERWLRERGFRTHRSTATNRLLFYHPMGR